MTTKIIGLDVSRSSVAAWALETKPESIKRYFKDNKDDCELLQSCRQDIEKLKEMRPNVVVMEPTGVNYSKLWAKAALDMGAVVLWVGHAQLKSTRLSYMLPNKNDPADALALALYGFDHLGDPDYFVNFDPFSPAAQIRERALQLSHIARVQSPVINRIRQNLAHEWPEKANSNARRKTGSQEPPSLWRYIAGREVTPRSNTIYSRSLYNTCGSGLSEFTKLHAGHLCAIHDQEIAIEAQLELLLKDPALDPYHQVFNKFGMGQRIRAMILGHIFPIESFLGPGRKPIVEWVNTKSKKKSCRHRSLAAFKLRLGAGMVEDSSGQTTKMVAGGSSLCRKALWQWIFTRIEPAKSRPNNKACQELGTFLDDLKARGIPAQLARSRAVVRAVESLFYELAHTVE